MLEVRVQGEIGAPAAEVWRSVGDFNSLPGWLRGIRASRLEGAGAGCLRHLEIAGGRWAVERLERLDEEERLVVYTIVDSSLPVRDYTSTMRLSEVGPRRCHLEWSAVFEAKDSEEEAVSFVRGAYEAGLEGLRVVYGR